MLPDFIGGFTCKDRWFLHDTIVWSRSDKQFWHTILSSLRMPQRKQGISLMIMDIVINYYDYKDLKIIYVLLEIYLKFNHTVSSNEFAITQISESKSGIISRYFYYWAADKQKLGNLPNTVYFF